MVATSRFLATNAIAPRRRTVAGPRADLRTAAPSSARPHHPSPLPNRGMRWKRFLEAPPLRPAADGMAMDGLFDAGSRRELYTRNSRRPSTASIPVGLLDAAYDSHRCADVRGGTAHVDVSTICPTTVVKMDIASMAASLECARRSSTRGREFAARLPAP